MKALIQRTALATAAFAAAFACMMGLLVTLNNSTPELANGGRLSDELAARGCTLSEWESSGSGLSHSFSFESAASEQPLSLVISNVYSFDVYCNGEHVYRYDDSQREARTKLVDLPPLSGETVLKIVFQSPQQVIAQIGAKDTMEGTTLWGMMFYAFCAGMLVLMLIYCLSLLLQKRDEILLFYMIALIALLLFREASQFVPFLSQYQASRMKQAISYLLVGGMVLLCARFTFSERPARVRKRELGFAMALVASIILTYALDIDWLSFGLLVFYHLACSAVAIYGCARRVACSWALMITFAFAFCLLVYYAIVDQALIPGGMLALQGYAIQLYNVPFLLACIIAINHTFVGYYRELKQINAELDVIIERRVNEYQEQERKKHQLMTNIFHDLRSPLFVAHGCVNKLKSGQNEEETLAVLENRIEFLERLTENLFTIAKMESGNLLFVEDRVDISALCQRQGQAYKVSAQQKGYALSCEIADSCFVWGDEFRIEQMVQNLLDNAIAHTPSGGHILFKVEKGADIAAVSVQDSGKGISPEDAPYVFDRYYHSAAGGSGESTGLGLAIVHEIMKVHRGSVRFDTVAGKGTVFVAEFPLLHHE